MNDASAWLTPAQLAAVLSAKSPESPVTARWVRDHMRSGDIPHVKVGRNNYVTPACLEEMERRAVAPTPARTTDIGGFGRVMRGKAS